MAASLYNRTLTDPFNAAGDIGAGFDAGVTAQLVTGTYSFLATHTTSANLSNTLGPAVALTGLTSSIVGGFYVLDSDAVTFNSVTGGTAEAIILYQTTGGGLILFQDSISVVANGGNITVTPNVNGWFRIPIA